MNVASREMNELLHELEVIIFLTSLTIFVDLMVFLLDQLFTYNKATLIDPSWLILIGTQILVFVFVVIANLCAVRNTLLSTIFIVSITHRKHATQELPATEGVLCTVLLSLQTCMFIC